MVRLAAVFADAPLLLLYAIADGVGLRRLIGSPKHSEKTATAVSSGTVVLL